MIPGIRYFFCCGVFGGGFGENGRFLMVFGRLERGELLVRTWWIAACFVVKKNMPTF
jgi:hypothetical protein